MGKKRKLLWQLYPSYLLTTLLCLVAVSWYATSSLRHFYYDRTEATLEDQARLVMDRLEGNLTPDQTEKVDEICEELGERGDVRITVILPSGEVLGDTREEPARMENHANRPEIAKAFRGDVGQSVRYSSTLQQEMMYVALPVTQKGGVQGVIRTSVPVTSMEHALNAVRLRIALAGAVLALVAAGIVWLVSRHITHPLAEMTRRARRFAEGDLSMRLPVPESEELAGLAETLNKMAAELDDRIRTVMRQRGQLEGVLSSMQEGVIAVDRTQRILTLNEAVCDLLDLQVGPAKGRNLQEVIRNPSLQRIVRKALTTDKPQEAELSMQEKNGEARFLQVRATELKGAQGQDRGVLVVLNDVSRIKKLENIRRDFVANVSHELKTPITSIKGFVENLLDGALEDTEQAERFLRIVSKQAERLNAIINDLLALSSIEEEAERSVISRQKSRIADVLQGAVQTCNAKAEERDVEVAVECDDNLWARINPRLLEQAVINLLDNAIKYSDSGSSVTLTADAEDGEVVVSVRDRGCGISREHLSRLFERFYRVDKARSRKMGGTGLGLAIVKHISRAHGGRVEVESTLGEGSMFSIHLPRAHCTPPPSAG